ncbi:hypothetical protein [Persicobacter sp. CCB-QB2]|uniref:hypothetical protein n=1 Tax=Persicobacter sp. CCB-QB2 TaxID=1561025 RepID=UPI0006A9DC51|nr:hypothetical protein [Persicobacter sp. CCB-QB2]
MKKALLSLLLFLASLSFANAQIDYVKEDKPPLKDRLFFGGNFGLSFGTFTYIEVSPTVGVMVTPKFSTGLGVVYQYYEDKRFDPKLTSSTYGFRWFGRYNIYKNFFLRGEVEGLNLEVYNVRETKREWVPGVFLGAGYFQPFGKRGGVSVSVLYNFTYDEFKSPYSDPYVIRVGFAI